MIDANSISFTVPEIIADNYTFIVFVENIGIAGSYDVGINIDIASMAPLTGSLFGNILTISGKGFNNANIVMLGDE